MRGLEEREPREEEPTCTPPRLLVTKLKALAAAAAAAATTLLLRLLLLPLLPLVDILFMEQSKNVPLGFWCFSTNCASSPSPSPRRRPPRRSGRSEGRPHVSTVLSRVRVVDVYPRRPRARGGSVPHQPAQRNHFVESTRGTVFVPGEVDAPECVSEQLDKLEIGGDVLPCLAGLDQVELI